MDRISTASADQEKSTYGNTIYTAKDGGKVVGEIEDHEVFNDTADGVSFHTVAWPHAAMIFCKILCSTGIMSIPAAMASLGAVGGALVVVGWGVFNTYSAYIAGNFKQRHPHVHGISDMAGMVGGPVAREASEFLFVLAFLLGMGSGIVGVTTAINTFSNHAACTVWWSVIAMVVIIPIASIRKLHQIAWLTWVGFASILAAVFTVTIAVTTRDRPAAAPQTGPYEFGYYAIGHTTFSVGIVACCNILLGSAGHPGFIPVISEMKNSKDYNKALFASMGFINTLYLSLSLVIYRWCGKWVASPSLGSAGHTIQIVAYAIGLVGLTISSAVYLHICSKTVFVRILRNSEHLQANTLIHWGTWLGCTIGLGIIAFILAEAIPIFQYLLALTGSFCLAPLAIMVPGALYMYDYPHYRRGTLSQKVLYWFHAFWIPFGAFITVGGTYGVVLLIKDAYDSGAVGSAFSCADNS